MAKPQLTEEDLRGKLKGTSLQRGVILFLLFTAAGFCLIFLLNRDLNVLESISYLRHVRSSFVPALISLMLLDWSLGAYRLYIFAHNVNPEVSFWDCFRANLANMFMGGVTPSQTGGGAAHLYILNRAGLPLSAGIASSVIAFLTTVMVLFLGAAASFWYFPALSFGKGSGFLRGSAPFIAFFVLLSALGVLAPVRVLQVFRLLLSPVRLLSRRTWGFLERGMDKLYEITQEYKGYMGLFLLRRTYIVLYSVILTGALYFNKFFIGYVVAEAMGLKVAFWPTVLVQVLVTFISYVAPSPGGSGIAELSSSYFMSNLIPVEATPAFAGMWRILTMYCAMAMGGLFLTQQLRRDYLKLSDRTNGPRTGGRGRRAPSP